MNETSQGRVLWELPVPAPRSAPSPLSRESIVRAAARLADREGLSGVSMRSVAHELAAGPMRLYGFVRTKEDLIDLMVDGVYGEVARELGLGLGPGPGLGGGPEGDLEDGLGRGGAEAPVPATAVEWRIGVHAVATALRAAAFRHAWIVDVLGGRPHLGPHALAVLEATAAAIAACPVDLGPEALLSALGTVNAYVFGAIRADVVEARSANRALDAVDADDLDAYLTRVLEAGDHPTLRRLVSPFARQDLDQEFAWGLDAILDGLAHRTGQRR